MTPEERRAYIKAWHAANPRDRRAYKAAYDAAHKAESAAYREANRDQRKAQRAAYYCREARPLTVDHDLPLARGGTDDIANILPACRSCNSRKNTRTALEFMGIPA